MVVTLSLPDDLWAAYTKHDPVNPQAAVVKQLKRFKEQAPSARTLIFSPEELKILEALYGKPVDDTKKFIEWLRGMLTIKLEGVEFTFTPSQLERARVESNFFAQPFPDYVKAKLKRSVLPVFGY